MFKLYSEAIDLDLGDVIARNGRLEIVASNLGLPGERHLRRLITLESGSSFAESNYGLVELKPPAVEVPLGEPPFMRRRDV